MSVRRQSSLTAFGYDGVTVRVATTANVTIATALNNGDTIDGVSLVTGDRVLVKNQTTQSQNGVYVVAASPARAADFDTFDEHAGALISVTAGTANANRTWRGNVTPGGILGTTSIVFTEIDDSTVYDSNSPIVGWESLVGTSNVTASSAAAGYPVSNLANPSTVSRWRATSSAANNLTLASANLPINYLAIARHNLAEAGVGASIQVNTGGGLSEVIPNAIPADGRPLIFQFATANYTQVRLVLAAGSAAAEIAVMYVGLLLTLQRRIYVGHTPVTFGRSADVMNGMSEDGNFLGRIVRNELRETSVALRNLTPLWYRNKMDPFVESGIQQPFFFAWRPGTYPRETGFGWFPSVPKPVNSLSNGMMSVDFSVRGVT